MRIKVEEYSRLNLWIGHRFTSTFLDSNLERKTMDNKRKISQRGRERVTGAGSMPLNPTCSGDEEQRAEEQRAEDPRRWMRGM